MKMGIYFLSNLASEKVLNSRFDLFTGTPIIIIHSERSEFFLLPVCGYGSSVSTVEIVTPEKR